MHAEPGGSRAGIWLGDELGDLGLFICLLADFLPGLTSVGAAPSTSGVVGFGQIPLGVKPV